MNKLKLGIALAIVCVLILTLVYFYAERVYKKMRQNIRGKVKESVVNRLLSTLSPRKYVLIKNALIPTLHGHIQVDHVLVSTYGIFVVESIDWGGSITGNQSDDEWLQCDGAGIEHTHANPIINNQTSVYALQQILGLGFDDFIPILAFISSVELDLQVDITVANVNNLNKKIKSYRDKRFTRKQMLYLASEISK